MLPHPTNVWCAGCCWYQHGAQRAVGQAAALCLPAGHDAPVQVWLCCRRPPGDQFAHTPSDHTQKVTSPILRFYSVEALGTCIAVFSFLASAAVLGWCQAQHERERLSSAEQDQRNLQAQRGIFALVARFFILHASKVVALMLFWAAMQRPGGFGWLLTGEHTSSHTRN